MFRPTSRRLASSVVLLGVVFLVIMTLAMTFTTTKLPLGSVRASSRSGLQAKRDRRFTETTQQEAAKVYNANANDKPIFDRVMENSTTSEHRLSVHETKKATFYVHNDVPADPPTGRRRRLPQCIVFGTPKTGTYTLKSFLGFHPDIVIPARDEVRFFCDESRYARGYLWYRNQMSKSFPGQVTLEKSPQCLFNPRAPERVYRMKKTIKLMLVVRHPFHRAVSCYLHQRATFGEKIPDKFELLVVDKNSGQIDSTEPCIEHSLYGKYLPRWLKRFDHRQIHVIDGDNLAANPAQELKLVEQFLEVRSYFKTSLFYYNKQKGFYCLRLKKGEDFCMPSSKGRPHPGVSKAVRRKLLDYFEPYNQMFYKMVGRDFNWTTDINVLGTKAANAYKANNFTNRHF